MTVSVSRTSRRERARAATVAEIKQTALDLMHDQGSTDVRFTDIARAMGITAPALYRYYADRDELLTELIGDAYEQLGDEIAARRDRVDATDIGGRWCAVAGAFRDWALAEPQRFALVFGSPVPGYVAPVEGRTTEAAHRAMAQLTDLFAAASRAGTLLPPLVPQAPAAMAECAREKQAGMDDLIPVESFQAMMQAWASLHGFVCLECYGHLDWASKEARGALFANHVTMIARASGLPTAR